MCVSVNAVMAELMVYEKRTCTTCKNLAVLLEERGIDFDRVDFHVEPLSAERDPGARREDRPAGAGAVPRARAGLRRSLGSAIARSMTTRPSRLMAEHTELMQRPVVVRGDRAVLARPVERVPELLD